MLNTAAPVQWPAPGKLNLFLFVTGRREDGYHNLQTLFQLLDYGDTLTIVPRQDEQIRLLSSLPGVANEQNLVLKAAKLLQHTRGSRQGADITLVKRLPLGGGLGGGSSDAATTLAVLNQLWGCCLPSSQLQQLGLMLGADVPLFLAGQSAFAQGIGEQLWPVSLKERWYLILHPGIQIDTALIFNHPELKRDSPVRSLEALRCLPTHCYRNDCEAVAKKYRPQVEVLIAWLLHYAPARLTGTGACVFAEFPNRAIATQVLRCAPTWAQGFVARGINHSPLRGLLANQ